MNTSKITKALLALFSTETGRQLLVGVVPDLKTAMNTSKLIGTTKQRACREQVYNRYKTQLVAAGFVSLQAFEEALVVLHMMRYKYVVETKICRDSKNSVLANRAITVIQQMRRQPRPVSGYVEFGYLELKSLPWLDQGDGWYSDYLSKLPPGCVPPAPVVLASPLDIPVNLETQVAQLAITVGRLEERVKMLENRGLPDGVVAGTGTD